MKAGLDSGKEDQKTTRGKEGRRMAKTSPERELELGREKAAGSVWKGEVKSSACLCVNLWIRL